MPDYQCFTFLYREDFSGLLAILDGHFDHPDLHGTFADYGYWGILGL